MAILKSGMTNRHQNSGGLLNGGTIESARLQIGENQAHYLRAGSGPPVVLLHGGASNSQDWAETMVALSHSYNLYAPDLIGYGLSQGSSSGYYLSDFTEFTLGFVRALGLDSAVLVGHSLGGRVCLELALRYPEKVSRLVLVDTVGFSRLARWGMFLGTAAWGVRQALGRPQPYPRLLKADGEDDDWMCLKELPALKVPTLIVWNRHDPYFSLKGALKARKLIPQAHLEVFPGYGHAPHLRDRESFNSLLLSFLDHE